MSVHEKALLWFECLSLSKLTLKFNCIKRGDLSQIWVAHTCNPSYSGGRAQDDSSSRPDWENSL
jgi:hypothetical protein